MLLVVVAAALLLGCASALNNGVGRTPAMGYNTWNDFRCSGITAANIMAAADKMVEYGLLQVGFNHLNIDDCWSVGREPNGTLIPDPTGFPDGIGAVADYVHSKGLKYGMYTDRGVNTCAGRPGSQGYEVIDANTFAGWGVDYLKEDSCNATQVPEEAFYQYGVMRDALNQTGRHIYFSLCGWEDWYAPVGFSLGNSWRINGDAYEWPYMVAAIFVNQNLSTFAHPGGWNDPDMLVGSNPQAAVFVTPDQSRTQFSLWSVMAAPLLIGSNMLNMSGYDLETYTNTEIIAVDQDPLGIQSTVIWENCQNFTGIPACQQIWAKLLSDGSYALCAVNYDVVEAYINCDETCFGAIGMTAASVRDQWAHEELGVFTNLNITIGANGASRSFRVYSA